MRNRQFLLPASVSALLCLLALSPRASADQFWNGPDTTGNIIGGGTGTWTTGNTNWVNAGVGGSRFAANTPVIFSATAGIVTLGSDVTINGNPAPSNITLNGNPVTFLTTGYVINSDVTLADKLVLETPLTVTVNPGVEATINAPIAPFEPPVLTVNAAAISILATVPDLTKEGAGTLILGGVNTYTGATAINAGVLSISNDLNLGAAPGPPVADQLTFDGGTLRATANITLAASRGVTLNAGGGTFDVTSANNALTIDGVIAGPGRLTKVGTGTLNLAGINSYSGATTVSAGVLQAGSVGAFSAVSAFTVNTGAFLDLNGFDNTVGSLSGSGLVTNSGGFGELLVNATLSVGADNTSTTFGGVLQDGGVDSTLALTKVGTGTLTLTRTNTYTGITTINAGVLSISQDLNLGAVPLAPVADQLTFNGGTLQATESFPLATNRGITLLGGGGTIDVTDSKTLTYGGVIADGAPGGPGITIGVALAAGSLTKIGTGTLTLTGANTYTGGTNLNGGILAVNNDGNLGTGPLSFDGGTLEALGDVVSAKLITLNPGGGTFLADADTISNLSGIINGAGAWTKDGPGTLILTADNTYTGLTTISAGTLQLGAGGTTGSIVGDVTDNGILAFDHSNALTFGGVISGAGSVQQNGTGTTVLVGDSAYKGGTTISAGTLQLGAGGTTGSIVGDVTDNGILAFDHSNALTVGGVISGAGSVQQNGTGTTVLVGDSTYKGGTTISAGTLQLGAGGTTGSIVGDVTDNGILAFDHGNILTFGGVISGAGSVQQNGTGTTVLVGDSTYKGGTTISAGTLQLGAGGTTGSIAGDVTDNGILAFDHSNALTFGGVISGAGSVQQNGTGTTVLVGDSTYKGGTTISAGTLQLGAGGTTGSIVGDVTDNGILAFDHSNALTFGGVISGAGSVQQNGTGTTVLVGDSAYKGGTTISAGTLQLGAGGTTGSIVGDVTDNGILAFDHSNALTVGGVISGAGSVQQNGTGTTVLVGDSTYKGGTTISAGTLQLGAGGTTGSIVGDVTDNGILAFDHGNILTFGGVISGAGSVQQNGTGTTVLVGDSTYKGGTTISAGTLQLGAGGTTGSIAGDVTDNGILAFDHSNALTFGGVISGAGSVQQNGTGTTVLVGDSTYKGGTTISAGTLQLGAGGTTGSIVGDVTDNGILAFDHSNALTFGGVISGAGSVQQNGTGTTVLVGDSNYKAGTAINAGTLQLGNGGTTGSIIGDVANNGVLVFDHSNVLTFDGVISGAGSVQQNGTGTTVLVGDSTFNGGTAINAGMLQLGNGGSTGSIIGDVANKGILVFDHSNVLAFDGVISGAGSVQQNGTGTTVLVGDSTYTGGTTINSGALQLGNGGATGSITGDVIDNGSLAFNRSNAFTFAGAISGTGGVAQIGTGTTTLSGNNTYTGGTTVSAGTLRAGSLNGFSSNSEFTVNSILDLNGFNSTIGSLSGNGTVLNNGAAAAALTVGTDNASTSFDGVLENGTSALQLTKAGTGTLTLTGTNTYSGGTIVDTGTLQAGSTTGFSPNSEFTVNSTLDLNGFNNTIGSLSGTGTVSNNGATAAALTVGTDNASTSFDGVLKDGTSPLELTKSGSGTLILVGTNTYSGGTIVNAGILQAGSTTGLSPSSAFTVNSILDLHGFNSAIRSLSGTGTVLNNGATPAALTLGANNASTTFNGTLKNGTSPLQLTKSGNGTLTLTGTNTYTGGTTISAGTLQLGNGGTTGSIIGNVIDNGSLTFDRSDPVTFAGAISGTGSVNQIGTGTTTLTGDNTFTGGTTVTAGMLRAGSATGLSPNSDSTVNSVLDLNGFNNTTGSLSGTGTVLNNGATAAALNVGAGNTSTVFNGVIEDGTSPLQLTKSGTGTLVLTGTNTYTGGTTISAGTLQLGNGGTTGSITGNVIDNGSLAFDRSDAVTFAGVIAGTGNLIKLGPGTLTLTGTNIYTGGTTITAGTLQIGNGGTTGSIVGDVADNAVLAFDRSDSFTFGGVISGKGDVVKTGAGTLTLPGTNTYTGTTTVDAGSLIVDGSIDSAQTTVNSGGLLGGHGFIGGSVVNNGIIRQVNSPGTLTIKGNYTQNASGTLSIAVAGLASNQHDLLAIQGHASLAGTLQLIRQGGFNLQPGNQITFLTANNGVNGTFGTVQNDFSTGTLVNGEVVYLPNSVVLEATQGSFSQAASSFTPNQQAVARALDSAAGDPRAAGLFAFINSQPLSSLPEILNLISPEQVTSFQATGAAHGNVQISNLGGRMANIHAGSTGFSSAGLTLTGSAASIGEGFAGVSGSEGKSGPSVFAPIPENRWGVFATGVGEFTNVDSTPNATGYNLDTGGMTLGVDYRLLPFLAIGLTAGYAHTNVDINANGGNIDVNSGQFGLYATLFSRGFYLDTAVSGGPNGYITHRKALQGIASGSTDGSNFNTLVAAGYDWKFGGLSIGPTANFQYAYIGLGGFTETGSLAPLTYPNQSSESERTQFGLKTSYDFKIGQVDILPQLNAAWQHEYGVTTYSIVASFANGAGNSFTVNGPPIGRDSLLIGAGFSVILNQRVTTYLYYDGEFLRTNYLNNNVSAGIRVTF